MTEKELRKLNRRDLLEMLIMQAKRTEELQTQLNESKQQLEDKELTVSNAGSMAEAALKLNGIFEAADAAAAQYIKSVSDGDVTLMTASQADYTKEAEEIISDAKNKAQEIIDKATAKAKEITGEAEKNAENITAATEEKCRAREEKAKKYVDAVNAKITQLYGDYKELFITLQGVLKESAGEKKS